MSGGLSIPFAFAALFTEGHPKRYFAALAFVALWVFAIRLAWKNYQIMVIEKQKKERAMLTAMIDLIKNDRHQNTLPPIPKFQSIGVLIKFAHEIETEELLKYYCQKFENLGYGDPLKNFRPILEEELKNEWLPVLIEARHKQHDVKAEYQFLDFLATQWSGKEKWKKLMEAKNTKSFENKG